MAFIWVLLNKGHEMSITLFGCRSKLFSFDFSCFYFVGRDFSCFNFGCIKLCFCYFLDFCCFGICNLCSCKCGICCYISFLNIISKSSSVAGLGLPGAHASAAADSQRNGRSSSLSFSSLVGMPSGVSYRAPSV